MPDLPHSLILSPSGCWLSCAVTVLKYCVSSFYVALLSDKGIGSIRTCPFSLQIIRISSGKPEASFLRNKPLVFLPSTLHS